MHIFAVWRKKWDGDMAVVTLGYVICLYLVLEMQIVAVFEIVAMLVKEIQQLELWVALYNSELFRG